MANKRRTTTRTQLSALGTDLGSIVRLDSNKFNSLNLGFVLDKILQLKETPIANPIIHSSSEISSSDTFQIFHHDFISSETGNYFLTDVMINPTHKPVFSTRNLFQKSSTGTSAFALKFTSQEFEFSFNLFNFGGLEKLFVRCNSEILDSQVHPKNLILQVRVYGAFLRECEKEKASAFFVNNQKTFSNFPTEILFITIRDSKRNFNPSFDCRDAQNIILERSRTRKIVSNRTKFNNWICFCLFNHPTSLFNTGNRKLRRQSHFSQIRINKRMKLNIISNFHSPSDINTMLKSFLIEINCINNLLSWFNFNFSSYSDLHKEDKDINYLNISDGIFPPKPKGMGIQNAKLI